MDGASLRKRGSSPWDALHGHAGSDVVFARWNRGSTSFRQVMHALLRTVLRCISWSLEDIALREEGYAEFAKFSTDGVAQMRKRPHDAIASIDRGQSLGPWGPGGRSVRRKYV